MLLQYSLQVVHQGQPIMAVVAKSIEIARRATRAVKVCEGVFCLSVSLSACLPVCLSVSLSVYLSVYLLSVYLSKLIIFLVLIQISKMQ